MNQGQCQPEVSLALLQQSFSLCVINWFYQGKFHFCFHFDQRSRWCDLCSSTHVQLNCSHQFGFLFFRGLKTCNFLCFFAFKSRVTGANWGGKSALKTKKWNFPPHSFISLLSRGTLRLKPTGWKERGTKMATLRRLVLSLRPRPSARLSARPPSLGPKLWKMKRDW